MHLGGSRSGRRPKYVRYEEGGEMHSSGLDGGADGGSGGSGKGARSHGRR